MIANANRGSRQIVFGKDSVVVQKFISGIPGGRTLKVEGFPLSVIPAGHVIIEKEGVYSPMPVSAATTTVYGASADATTTYETSAAATAAGVENPVAITKPVLNEAGEQTYAYGSLPQGAKYVGINYRTIEKTNPQSSIMYDGVVNPECMYVSIESIKSAFAAAVPHIIFQKDEDAGSEYNA